MQCARSNPISPAVLLALAVSGGCTGRHVSPVDQLPDTVAVTQEMMFRPGTFGGILPCASCPGIETRILFQPDHTFRRSRIYLNGEVRRDTVFDIGRWRSTIGGLVVVVNSVGEMTRFQAAADMSLRQLAAGGMPIVSEENHILRPTGDSLSRFGPARMRGMYTYFADAAVFDLCETSLKFPVAMVERHEDLERAYLRQRKAPGAPLLVEINARLELQPTMEGDQMGESVVVTDFLAAYENASCRGQTEPQDSTSWTLSELRGIPVQRSDPASIPTLTFLDDEISGTTGCNRFAGSVHIDGTSLVFGPLATTRRACADTLEAIFLENLGMVDSFRIYGADLELNSRGNSIAVLTRLDHQ